jgi:16S rRNA (cytosine967-C5)-methyltransferase
VNAVLRSASRERPVLTFVDDIDRISVETSHPRWLVEKWVHDLGIETAANVAAANNQIAFTAFRVIGRPSDEVQRLVESARASIYVDNCYIVDKTDETLHDLAEKGEIYLQDEASQMVAQSVVLTDGIRFLDVCAAPGGKTGLIARRASGTTASVVAGDLHRTRVAVLRDNCRRQGVDLVSFLQHDGARGLPFGDETFDVVLVDAPCSGTGTIRRNPEIRYLLAPEGLPELSAKQLAILKNASKLVRRGGTLVYSTCSLESEENEALCRQFLAVEPLFETVAPVMPAEFCTADGFARTWPHRDGMDGFFVAAFRRK